MQTSKYSFLILLSVLMCYMTVCDIPQVPAMERVLFPIRVGAKWGYIDKKGQVFVSPSFDAAEPFCGGLAVVRTLVVTSEMEGDVSSGLGRVARYGYIDAEGNITIEPRFRLAFPFTGARSKII
jgi:hypothetical protein